MGGNCCLCKKEPCYLFPRQFHRFPVDAERRKKWLQSIGYPINLYKNTRICSDHFTENDYYTCDILPHKSSRRLKKTAIPSVFTQRSDENTRDIQHDIKIEPVIIDIEYGSTTDIQHDIKNESIMDIQHGSTMDIQHDIKTEPVIMDIQHGSTTDIQHDIKTEPVMDIQHGFTIDIQHDIKTELVIMDIQHGPTTDIQHDIKTEPVMDIQHGFTTDIQHDIKNESVMDIQHGSTADIQHHNPNKSIMDIQYRSTTDIRHNSPTKSTLGTNQTGKQSNERDKMIIKSGKYSTECFRRTEFVTNQSWMKLTKCINYYRYINKLLLRQNERNKRLQNEITILKSLLRLSESKKSSVTNA